jgi:hypothetical protein
MAGKALNAAAIYVNVAHVLMKTWAGNEEAKKGDEERY